MKSAKETRRSMKGKKKFTIDEDEVILSMFAQYGNQWKLIASSLSDRTPRQCRERFKYYLAPYINHNEWTTEEDNMIMEKFEIYGSRWSKIASYFENRTDIDIKNRFNLLKRAQKRETKKMNVQSIESSPDMSSDDYQTVTAFSNRSLIQLPAPISRVMRLIC